MVTRPSGCQGMNSSEGICGESCASVSVGREKLKRARFTRLGEKMCRSSMVAK